MANEAPAAPPRFLQIEPVGECNLRCRMCAIQFRGDGAPPGPRAFLDFERFLRVLDELPGLEELQLQGLGEPLMHPRFFEMVEAAVARGVRVSTNTNLTYLTRRRAERCVTSGLDAIHVSLDGASAETYEGIRVRARFAAVLGNLDTLMAARARLGSDTPSVRWIVVAMRRNLRELADVVRLAHAHGVDTVFVQHLCHDFGEETLPERYRPMRDFVAAETLAGEDEPLVERCFAEAREAARRAGVELRLPRTRPRPHPAGTPGPKRCDWPWRGPYVSFDGRVMPCCMISTPDRAELGALGERPLAEIWNGPAYRTFRDALASDEPPAVCRSCAVYTGTF